MTESASKGRSEESTEQEFRAALRALPVPDIDVATSARVLGRARGELRMRGEGTVSLAGFLSLWDANAVPALVLLTGVVYGGLSVVRMIEIFVT